MASTKRGVGSGKHFEEQLREPAAFGLKKGDEEGGMVTSEYLGVAVMKRLGLSGFVPGDKIRTDWSTLQERFFFFFCLFINDISKYAIGVTNEGGSLQKYKVCP